MLTGKGTATVAVSLPSPTGRAIWMLLDVDCGKRVLKIWAQKKLSELDELAAMIAKYRDNYPIELTYIIASIEPTTIAKLRDLVIDNFNHINAAELPNQNMKLGLSINSIIDRDDSEKKETICKDLKIPLNQFQHFLSQIQ